MKVYLVMGNSVPDSVFDNLAAAEDRLGELKEKELKEKPFGSARIYWHTYEMDLQS